MNYVNNYNEAKCYLSKGRNKEQRTIGNNTTIENRPDNISVKYHDTDIVSYFPDGKTKINTGGWKTSTTKERLNNFTNISIYQKKGIWYVINNSKEYFYKDGMTINKDGSISGADKVSKKAENKHAKLIKSINKYSKDFALAILSGDVPAPSGGDCWYCSMFESKDTGHLKEHVKEKYYVPSLLINAEKLFPVSPIVKGVIGEIWSGKNYQSDWIKDIFINQVSKTISKYLKMMFKIAR